jgi:hypothetical protein
MSRGLGEPRVIALLEFAERCSSHPADEGFSATARESTDRHLEAGALCSPSDR